MSNWFWVGFNVFGLVLNLVLGTGMSYFCAGANLILALHFLEKEFTKQ